MGFLISASANVATAVSVTWDADAGTAGAQDGSGTWSDSNANWWDGTTTSPWTDIANDVVIGSNSGAAGTITVSGTQKAHNLTFNQPGSGSYLLSGGIISLSGGATALKVANGVSAEINSILLYTAAPTFNIGTGSTLTLSGGTTIPNNANWTIAGTGTMVLKSGIYTTNANNNFSLWTQTNVIQEAASVVLNGGRLLIGYGGDSVYTINNAAAAITQTGTGDVSMIGRSNKAGTLNLKQGTISLVHDIVLAVDGNSTGNLIVEGGTLSLRTLILNGVNAGTITGSATATISGGVVTAAGMQFGAVTTATNGSPVGSIATLNMTGGALYLGAGGLAKGTDNTVIDSRINLSGGVIGATANWSSSMDMTLSATNGNITFKAANASNAARDIALSGILSGTGGLTKSGGGTLTLSGSNTYTGATSATAGMLKIAGSLNGSAKVDVAGATLATGNFGSIATAAGGNVNIQSGGILAPGASGSAGTLALSLGTGGKLNFASGSTLAFDLGTTSDLITFNTVGDWLSGGGAGTTLVLTLGSGFSYTNTYTIFQNVNTSGFAFSNIAGYDTANFTANLVQNGSNYELSFDAIPEPGTAALVSGGLGLLLGFQTLRCRKRKG